MKKSLEEEKEEDVGGKVSKRGRKKKFPLAPMGVLAPGSAHARPSAQPPSTLAEIFGARVCRVTFKIFKKKL